MMESFAEQMFNEIERRYNALHLSNSLVSLSEETNNHENVDEIDLNINDDTSYDKYDNYAEFAANVDKPEMIYANNKVIILNESHVAHSNKSVPSGRKPALPPKPLSLLEPNQKQFMQLIKKDQVTPREESVLDERRDPAEMSLKERLALFEAHKSDAVIQKATRGIILSSKQIEKIINNGNDSQTPALDTTILTHSEDHNKSTHVNSESTVITGCKEEHDDIDRIPAIESQMNDYLKKCSVPKPFSKATNTIKPSVKDSESRRQHQYETRSDTRESYRLENPNIHIIRSLYGDLTPIVHQAPTKMKPDETIGLNDLHQNEPFCSLLNESHQYQSKEEDRWDKFVECLLFFCCVP